MTGREFTVSLFGLILGGVVGVILSATVLPSNALLLGGVVGIASTLAGYGVAQVVLIVRCPHDRP